MDRSIAVDRVEDILNVFGSFDQNLHIIENEFRVRVTDRDSELKISGEPEDVMLAEKAVEGLWNLAGRSETIDETAEGWPEYVVALPESITDQLQA